MFRRLFNDIKKYFHYSVVSAKSQLKAEVANSYLNWIWWVLDPLCFMLIYTFIFGYVFNSSEKYFPVFIFIGLSMWDFFNRTIANSVKIVKNNKAIVSKVYLPKYILILIKLWVNAFKMMISFGIVGIMMFFYHVPASCNIIFFVPILLVLGLFTFGCGTFLLHYGVYVEDLANGLHCPALCLLSDRNFLQRRETDSGMGRGAEPVQSAGVSHYLHEGGSDLCTDTGSCPVSGMDVCGNYPFPCRDTSHLPRRKQLCKSNLITVKGK